MQRSVTQASAPKLRLLHLSDIHVDPKYTPGAEAKCSEPLCCRHGITGGKTKMPAGLWGTVSKCDVPYRTVEAMFQQISSDYKVSDGTAAMCCKLETLAVRCDHLDGGSHPARSVELQEGRQPGRAAQPDCPVQAVLPEDAHLLRRGQPRGRAAQPVGTHMLTNTLSAMRFFFSQVFTERRTRQVQPRLAVQRAGQAVV